MTLNYVHIVAVLAILQFLVFGVLVGRARAKYGIRAPAISGNEQFEREFRVQRNTLEQLVAFLPALLLAGRLIYRQSYLADPAKRAIGFVLTVAPTATLLVAVAVGALTTA